MSSSAHAIRRDEFATLIETTLPSESIQSARNGAYFFIRNPEGSPWVLSRGRRLLDITVSVSVLAIFALPMLLIAAAIGLTSPGPVFFIQPRVGRRGRMFSIVKFRTMTFAVGPTKGPGLTCEGDRRITLVGRALRKLKLDEIPQFINILNGEMSLVGPRPKSPKYAALRETPYRPGITGPATLVFRCEEQILKSVPAAHVEDFYQTRIRPLKARIDKRYMRRATIWTDLGIVFATFAAALAPNPAPRTFRAQMQIEEGLTLAHHIETMESTG